MTVCYVYVPKGQLCTLWGRQARSETAHCLAFSLLDDVFIEAQAVSSIGTAHTRDHACNAAYFSGLPESASIF